MGSNNVIFLEVIEWLDATGQELLHRIPEEGSGEIKYGAQLIVRESQAGIFFYNGMARDAFGPGRHTLNTANIPILNKILSLPWGMTSPLRAEVYFVNMKVFTNLKWGTRDPVAFKDSELGLVRLRAHGVFNIQVAQPVLFINTLVGTMGVFSTEKVEEYLKQVIVSRFNDYLGEHLDTIFNLPGRYEEMSTGLEKLLAHDFKQFGLGINQLYITSITPPPEVQQAIDDKSRLQVIEDLDGLIKLKAAAAMEKAAGSTGEAGSGMGLGLGLMMPAMFADALKTRSGAGTEGPAAVICPDCRYPVPGDAKFCPHCGHQQLIFNKCKNCRKNLAPNAKFCSRCGHAVDEKPVAMVCPHCRSENLPGANFCNNCGEKVS